MSPELRETIVRFARECFGNLFTRGKFAGEVLPTEDIEASIACILACEDGRDGRASSFGKELESLLNHYSKENDSNTPDFILAEYLRQCLAAWNLAIAAREEWYGRKLSPGTINANPQSL
jgi:hypothetical protein